MEKMYGVYKLDENYNPAVLLGTGETVEDCEEFLGDFRVREGRYTILPIYVKK